LWISAGFFQSWFLLAFHGLDRCPRVSEEGTQKDKGFSDFVIIFLETSSNVIFDFLTIIQNKILKHSHIQQDE
jgi:hypothetical protein